MNQPEPPETTASRATITAAKIALIGTVLTAVIAATATITAAVVQRNNPPTPNPVSAGADALSATSTPMPTTSSSTLPRSASSTTPAAPDGVSYQCVGSVPTDRIAIIYGPGGNAQYATSLPFTAHDDTVQHHDSPQLTVDYGLGAQLKGGGGHVTCTLTVTDYGKTYTNSGTASGADNEVDLYICPDGDHYWRIC